MPPSIATDPSHHTSDAASGPADRAAIMEMLFEKGLLAPTIAALHEAAARGNVKRIAELLGDDPVLARKLATAPYCELGFREADLDRPGVLTTMPLTALHVAAGHGHRQAVDALLPVSDANATTGVGDSALVLAARNGHVECVEALLPHTDKSIQTLGGSPLVFAAAGRHPDCVRALLPHYNAQQGVGDGTDLTLLMIAVLGAETSAFRADGETSAKRRADDLATVRLLIPVSDVRWQSMDQGGQSALMLAAKQGRSDLVAALLPHSDASQHDFGGRTALMIAAEEGGDLESVRRLLAVRDPNALAASDPNARDASGRTALMLAAAAGHASIVRALLPVSDALAQSHGEETALAEAAAGGSVECVNLLLAVSDSNVNLPDANGRTALGAAAAAGQRECVERLIPLTTTAGRNRALIEAAANAQPECVNALLPHADPCASGPGGSTALMWALNEAQRSGTSERDRARQCIELLLPVSDIHQQNNFDESAFRLALSRSSDMPAIASLFAAREREELIDAVAAAPKSARAAALAAAEAMARADEKAGVKATAKATASTLDEARAPTPRADAPARAESLTAPPSRATLPAARRGGMRL